MWGRRAELGVDRAAGWPRRCPDAERVDGKVVRGIGGIGGIGGSRGSILLEVPDGAEAYAMWHHLAEAGYAPTWCPGPGGSRRKKCPLVSRGDCPLVERADLVISTLDNWEPFRSVLLAQARRYPRTPVVIDAATKSDERLAPLAGGYRRTMLPRSIPSMLATVRETLA